MTIIERLKVLSLSKRSWIILLALSLILTLACQIQITKTPYYFFVWILGSAYILLGFVGLILLLASLFIQKKAVVLTGYVCVFISATTLLNIMLWQVKNDKQEAYIKSAVNTLEEYKNINKKYPDENQFSVLKKQIKPVALLGVRYQPKLYYFYKEANYSVRFYYEPLGPALEYDSKTKKWEYNE